MNIPNRITLIRLLLIPFIVFFYLATFIPFAKLIACILFLLAVLTDFFDGYLARKLNQVSVLGTFLDAIADKVLVLSAFLLVVADGVVLAPFGAISFIIIIFREFSISAFRQLCATKNVVLPADMWGKIKANFQFFTVLFFMLVSFFLSIENFSSKVLCVFNLISYILLFATVIITIISLVHYLIKNREVFKS